MSTETQTPHTTSTPPHHHTRVKIVRQVIDEHPPVAPPKRDAFRKVSQVVSNKAGSSSAFMFAILLIVIWGVTGPFFHFSDTWQLVINTGTTIVTFLMVFAIQNTQNRDSKAIQLKLNELIKGSRGARSEFVDIEDLSDGELDTLQIQFRELHEKLEQKKTERATNY